jgi:hypothetical protein
MPALVAGIHARSALSEGKDVDGRDKPGHDESKEASSNMSKENNHGQA